MRRKNSIVPYMLAACTVLGIITIIAVIVSLGNQTKYYTGVPIVGVYVHVGNPTFSGDYAIPGMVYAIDTEGLGIWGADTIDKYIYLTNASLDGIYDLLWVNEPNIPVGTVVGVLGEIWHREDVGGRTITLLEYTSIEVI